MMISLNSSVRIDAGWKRALRLRQVNIAARRASGWRALPVRVFLRR
ncbi:hypothetical protein ACERNI_13650 [Camelimonas sp. ID_303_24]